MNERFLYGPEDLRGITIQRSSSAQSQDRSSAEPILRDGFPRSAAGPSEPESPAPEG